MEAQNNSNDIKQRFSMRGRASVSVGSHIERIRARIRVYRPTAL